MGESCVQAGQGDGDAFVLDGVGKDFVSREGQHVRAVDGVSFRGPAGGVTCIVGPTGSGKSTLLRLASGLENPDRGSVRVQGHSPGELIGRIAYLTQRHTLFPWSRVGDNIGLPLELAGMESGQRDLEVRRIGDMLGLAEALDRYPHEISGGMQQRAALGRLLASRAPYWLLDEPFSALDERTHHHLQNLLLRLVRDHGVSVLFVTHSIDEAVFLADRIVVLSASPGMVVDVIDPELGHPRDRLAPVYGELIEQVRQKIEAVLSSDGGAPC